MVGVSDTVLHRKHIEELQVDRAKSRVEYEGLYKFQSIIKPKIK